ncbi:MAG: ABC transporter [Legionellales bacterium]|nr:ABC transporter [Legionellales bacterium]|tara:strand:+ start:163 stop:1077 length:915 start_codon:yes stop_codon:yes gene_type:complete
MNALEIKDLIKTYKSGAHALKGVSFEVKQGDFYALLGPNGAGKSTTIGIITSLVNKTSGQVKVFGIDIDQDFCRAKQHIGLMPQEFNFNIFETCMEVLIHQAGYYGVNRKKATQRAESLLKKLGLYEFRTRRVRMLSGGMKRRLMIARALIHEPKLLILDEPTAGVDIELRRMMWDFLRNINEQEGVTIILTTHYLEEAETLCKNIAIIDQGRVIEKTDMKSLLLQLNVQTYILDLSQRLAQKPNLLDFPCELLDEMTLAVDVQSTQDINHLFSQLSQQGIKIGSMRNKANRLEELFMKMTSKA